MKIIALGFLLGSLSWSQQQVAMSTLTPKTYEIPLHDISIYDGAEEPPTQRDTAKVSLNGILLEKQVEEGSSFLNLMFLFSNTEESPLTYFKHYNPSKKTLVIDIYNREFEENILSTIENTSTIPSRIVHYQVNLNEGIEGLPPDIRDVVRLSLVVDSEEINGKFRESDNTLNLRLSWKEKKEPGWRKVLPFF